MKYVHLENNKILGYYSEDINLNIPKGCLEITDEQWQEALGINANCYEKGKFVFKDFRTEEEIRKEEINTQIAEALKYLSDTDHKFYNGYKPKEGEDLVEIERLRDEAREFIRDNEI